MGDEYDYVTDDTLLNHCATNNMGGPKDNIAIAAAFFAGFHRMMTLLLNLNGSFLTLMRFGISPSKIGCYIGDTGSCMQFWNNWGILLSFGLTFCGWIGEKAFIAPGLSSFIYCLAFAYTCYVKKFSRMLAFSLFFFVVGPIGGLFFIGHNDYKQTEQLGKFVCPVVSIISSIGVFIAYCMLSRVCLSSHGYEGVRKLFFLLCASAFAYQFDQCMVTKVNGGQAAWFFLALELFGPLLPLLHWLAGLFGRCFGYDIEYCKLMAQIGMMIVLPFYGMCIWFVNAVYQIGDAQSKKADKEPGASLLRCLSPGFIGAIGLGSCFWLFPVVWPFMVCHYSWFQSVMFFSPILGASATLIVWAASDGGVFIGNNFDIKGYTKFDAWNDDKIGGGMARGYHATWGLLAVIFILFWIITCCVHYPRCFVARSVLHSRWAVFYGALLYFITQLFKAFGLTGVFANAIGPSFKTFGFTSTATFNANAKVKIENGHSVKLESFQITFNGSTSSSNKNITCSYPGRTIGGAIALGTGGNNKPIIILYGIVGGEPVKSLEVTGGTAVAQGITLGTESDGYFESTLKLGTTQQSDTNLDLTVRDNNAAEGQYKANTFTSSDAGNFLTKMEISLDLDSSSNSPTVDGYTMDTNKVKLTLVFNDPGIAGVAGTGFTVSDGNVDKSKSSLECLGGPQPDFTHGPTFGNVFVDFALFHMTASLFTAQAYSVGIGSFKCGVDSGCAWPTQGIGGFRSFCWWLGYGLRFGTKRFMGLAHVDIISVIS